MKINKIKFLSLFAVFSLLMLSCSDENDNETASSDPETAADSQEALEDAAFNVLRAFCQLPTDDDSENSEETSHDGIEYLPDNWQSQNFTPIQGFTKKEGDQKIRYMACNSIEEAREFYSSIIGESVDDSYNWSFSGLGSVNYTEIAQSTDESPDQYAKIEVSIAQIPDLTQLNFMSVSYMEDNAAVFDPDSGAENSYKGEPYYRAGDIIKRKKDGTIWMCVRPSGGPAKKGYSYFVCLDPFGTKDTNLIKSTSKNYVYNDETQKNIKKKWTFAKNLMSYKTAKATGHTFNILATEKIGKINLYDFFDSKEPEYKLGTNIRAVRNKLIAEGYDLRNLWASVLNVSEDKDKVAETDELAYFYIAYGSPQNDKKRKDFTSYTYVQPYLRAALLGRGDYKDKNGNRHIITIKTKNPLDNERNSNDQLLSVTDYYDYEYTKSLDLHNVYYNNRIYDFNNFLSHYSNNKVQYKTYYSDLEDSAEEETDYHKWSGNYFFSPEIKLVDKSPTKMPSKDYEDIYRSSGDGAYFDYWLSQKHIQRLIDGKEADWDKENKE